jgi:hypothetical protein
MRKILCALLVLAMALSVCAFQVFADEPTLELIDVIVMPADESGLSRVWFVFDQPGVTGINCGWGVGIQDADGVWQTTDSNGRPGEWGGNEWYDLDDKYTVFDTNMCFSAEELKAFGGEGKTLEQLAREGRVGGFLAEWDRDGDAATIDPDGQYVDDPDDAARVKSTGLVNIGWGGHKDVVGAYKKAETLDQYHANTQGGFYVTGVYRINDTQMVVTFSEEVAHGEGADLVDDTDHYHAFTAIRKTESGFNGDYPDVHLRWDGNTPLQFPDFSKSFYTYGETVDYSVIILTFPDKDTLDTQLTVESDDQGPLEGVALCIEELPNDLPGGADSADRTYFVDTVKSVSGKRLAALNRGFWNGLYVTPAVNMNWEAEYAAAHQGQGTDTPDTPDTPDSPTTGDAAIAVIAVAMVAAAGIVLVKKH